MTPTSHEVYRVVAERSKDPGSARKIHPILAYRLYLMMQAIPGDWSILSAVRTYRQQKYLYDGYRAGKAGFNLAANPDRIRGRNFEGVLLQGSNHQEGADGWGRAVDMRTNIGWSPLHSALSAHGLRLTVKGEPWHWAASDMTRWYDGPFPAPGFRTLSMGHRGNDVRTLQQQTVDLGETIGVDGDWGTNTDRAVRSVQQKIGVPADGRWSHEVQLAYAAAKDPRKKKKKKKTPHLEGATPATGFIEGIDLSHYQKSVDWKAVARDADWVYIKSSEGKDFTDPRWEENAAGAASVDIEWGAYHFATPSGNSKAAATRDGRAEAEFFLSKLAGKAPTLRPCLDLEQNKASNRAHLGAWIDTFLDVISDAIGVLPVVYTGFYFMKDEVGGQTSPRLGECPLWLAWYGRKLTDEPPAPEPWDDWDAWQYSSSGRRAGEDEVDLNVMRASSLPKMRMATAKKPAPPEEKKGKTWKQWADAQIRANAQAIAELKGDR